MNIRCPPVVFHQFYVTQWQSLAIVFSFILISIDNWLFLRTTAFCIAPTIYLSRVKL